MRTPIQPGEKRETGGGNEGREEGNYGEYIRNEKTWAGNSFYALCAKLGHLIHSVLFLPWVPYALGTI